MCLQLHERAHDEARGVSSRESTFGQNNFILEAFHSQTRSEPHYKVIKTADGSGGPALILMAVVSRTPLPFQSLLVR